ncbi:MAG: hypothetical protein EXS16_10275 [Gemmataceae bacterium]|nr:hypothetical protein [Gemmataceae bacterium]
MSETLPQTTTETIAYRPVSGWAVAGFVVGLLFAALVLVCTVLGLFQGIPVFFPSWMLAIPIVGLALSWLGQKTIHESEGTCVGAKLASTGLWLSLLSGLGYLAYYLGTTFAIESQANSFLMDKEDGSGFFARLREGGGEVNSAFLLTLPATHRGSAAPDDIKAMIDRYDDRKEDPGAFTLFPDQPLVRIFHKDLGKDAEITPQAVLGWKYAEGRYKVDRVYRIKTKEVEAEAIISVQSTEAESKGQGRRWFVSMRESALKEPYRLTPLGESVKKLRLDARLVLEQWAKDLFEGKGFAEGRKIDKTVWTWLPMKDEAERSAKQQRLYHIFDGKSEKRFSYFMVMTRHDAVGKWEIEKGKFRIHLMGQFTLHPSATTPPHKIDINFLLETVQAVDPATATDDTPSPGWRIVSYHVLRFMASQQGP